VPTPSAPWVSPRPPYGNHPRPTRVGSAAWRVIGAGTEFSAGIRRDGSLWTWGSNFLGELGIGSSDANRWVPTRVGNENDWKTIAVGYDWVLALKNDGSLWAWGGNDGGQLGIGSSDSPPDNEHPGVPHPTPIRIGSDTDWSAVYAGGSGSFALKRDGSLWAWGGNGDGQLGVGDTLDHWVPTRVGTATDWRTLADGSGYCQALKRNGSLWAWGENDSGQLGLGDTASRHRPTRVGHSTQWLRIAAGHASLAVKRDGTVWSWGDNFTGQLGLGDRHNRTAPTRITRLR
jgi:alpha-tubulin suppressor-like RCC1 family protein